MDLRQLVFHQYRNPVFIILALATSAFSIRPDGTVLPLIVTLSILLAYGPFLFRPDNARPRNVVSTWIALSVGSQASRIHASLGALSKPGTSLFVLFATSGILSALVLSTIYLSTRNPFSASRFRPTVFPALWATTWCTVSHLNPGGHLATWSAVDTEDSYKWTIPIIGSPGKDWIIAAWAVVFSEAIGDWYMGSREHDLGNQQTKIRQGNPKVLALFLTLLTIPSFFISSFPLSTSYSAVGISTPISVACALPSYTRYKNHVLTLSDYITESRTLQNQAKLILWPEGSVIFHSEEEREKAFNEVRLNLTSYIGVSFEETINDPADPTGRKSISQTGLAVISPYSDKPHLIYYKRNLVPVAESYRMKHSLLPPSIFEILLRKPQKWVSKEDWGGTNRAIPVTASICLDFAQASPFSELETRPALILAPARTWNPTVGYAMWLQAKQRAEELGAMVLWCDGGEGGVSGLAGGGFSDVSQVGVGSFVRSVGIQYPFDDRRTLYARFGDFVLVLAWFPVLFSVSQYGIVGRLGPLLLSFNRGPLSFIQHRIIRFVQWKRDVAAPQDVDAQNVRTGNLVDL